MNYHIIFDSSYEAFDFSLDALLYIIDAGGASCVVGEWLSERDALRRLRFLENHRYYNRVLLEIIHELFSCSREWPLHWTFPIRIYSPFLDNTLWKVSFLQSSLRWFSVLRPYSYDNNRKVILSIIFLIFELILNLQFPKLFYGYKHLSLLYKLFEIFRKIMIYNISKINFDNGNDEMKDCNTNLILSFNVTYLWFDNNFFNPRYFF